MSIRAKTRNGFLSCRVGWPRRANMRAMTEDATHSEGVIWWIWAFVKPPRVKVVSRVLGEK